MNRITPILFLLIGSLCFYAGYTVGVKKAPTAPRNHVAETSIVKENLETTKKFEETTKPESSAPPQPTAIDLAAEKVVRDHEFSIRAAQKEITFTDKKGRELVATVIQVTEDNLKVRRSIDGLEVDLPVAMLSETDQVFAAYLAENAIAPAASQQMSDKIWDELFK